MDASTELKKSHKEWRRIAKRERRRRLRRRAAVEREADEARLRAALEQTAEYSNWIQLQEQDSAEREKKEKEEHDRLEKLWLEEEVRSQKEWKVLQERKLKARQLQLEQEEKIREEFEAKQQAIRKKQEEEKRKREEEIKQRELLFKEIDDYIDNGIKTPEPLRELIDSQPGKELCPFFTKTGACRYGNTCSRNHQRVCLSKVILIPGFYTHFSLEKNSAEYDTDISLEFDSSETRQHFYEFYKDVLPELESYGRIKTLRYCCNTEVHLRGNLYIEYCTEREAARAVRSLKGRWYAGRQLNCEFCNLKSWRSAVCGTSKCPKGRACNFLHTFRNPHDEYDIKSPPRWAKQASSQDLSNSRRSEHSSRSKSKWEEVAGETNESKNWRWSESPEPETESRSKHSEKRRHRSHERSSSYKAATDAKHSRSNRTRGSENTEISSVRYHGSRSKKYSDEKSKDDDSRNGRNSSSKSHSSRSRRSRDDDDDDYESSKSSRRTHRSYSNGRNDRSSRSINEKHCERQESKSRSKHRESERRKSSSSSGLSSKTSDKLSRADERIRVKGKSHSKSKWDKQEYESSSPELSTSSDSTSASDKEEIHEEKSSNDVQSEVTKEVKDEWATTDSETDDNDQSAK